MGREELSGVLKMVGQKTHKPGHHPTAPEWEYRAGLEMVSVFSQEPKSTGKFLVMRQV